MIESINRVGFQLTSWIMAAFERVSPWAGLIFFSLLTAVAALIAYKFCSNQKALKRRKGIAIGRLLEIRLYQDDLPGIFGTLGRLGVATGWYLFESFKPLVVLLAPVMLLLFQLSCWYQFRPLQVEEVALVSIMTDETSALDELDLQLRSSPGITIETEPFRTRDGREALWRIRGKAQDPEGWVEFEDGNGVLRKSVSVAPSGLRPVSKQRLRDGHLVRLMYPMEPRIPDPSPIKIFRLNYGDAALYIGSREVNWIVALFVLSVLFGLILQKPFRVEF